jgi:uncharacterized DUF497 family protein
LNGTKISFEEARTVFYDDNSVIMPDLGHSYGEERFTIIGFSSRDRLLTVCHCERHNGEVTRIISARKATNIEKILYGGNT